ncbi:hypothetical protein [Natrialba sp. INN-245]|uniref:hypothetical protein n=1 Tax=Natrialba sp. INN-245 TaxID=2690967 RepID=UPI00131311E4|nr:hypothetical protein [Natrialba sp. INN-245]MWV40120.1 hypothetical protein [Natrialba sp. INN-245]
MNEFDEILQIEKERARERQGQRTDLDENDTENDEDIQSNSDEPRGNVSTKSDNSKARDKAAEKVNADVSGRTLEKGWGDPHLNYIKY